MAALGKRFRLSPQFGRASVGVTQFRRQIHFSENCFRLCAK
jgi:hypothetical protein